MCIGEKLRKQTSITDIKPVQKKKKEHLKTKVRQAQAEAAKWKDQYLRMAAEIDNYKKRTEKEISQIVLFSNTELLKKILPVLDDFERSLKFSEEKQSSEFRTGMELIYRKLQSVLLSSGLETMESVGRPFDIQNHDALLQMEKKGVSPGIVIEEHKKGYLLHGKVLRHAKVIVSN